MADKIELELPKVTIEGDTGTATLPEDSFMKNCPVEEKTVKSLMKYAKDYSSAVAGVAGALAADTMNKDKGVDKIVLEAPFMGSKNDGMTTTVKREVTYRAMKEGDDPITKPAITQVTRVSAFKNKAAIRTAVADLKEALA